MSFIKEVSHAIDLISSREFENSAIEIELDGSTASFFYDVTKKFEKSEVPRDLFNYPPEFDDWPFFDGLRIEKSEFTCLKNENRINPEIIQALRKTVKICLETLIANWKLCQISDENVDLQDDSYVILFKKCNPSLSSFRDMHALELFKDKYSFGKEVKLCQKGYQTKEGVIGRLFLGGEWKKVKQLFSELQMDAVEGEVPSLYQIACRHIVVNKLDTKQLPPELSWEPSWFKIGTSVIPPRVFKTLNLADSFPKLNGENSTIKLVQSDQPS